MIYLLFWFCYGFISVFWIVFLLVVLGRDKRFSYSFYRLVQCDLFLNLLTYLSTWVRRFYTVDETIPLMIHVYYEHHFIFHISGFCEDFFFHIQSTSSITLCVNRFTTARFSHADKFWSKHYLTVYFGVVIYSTLLILPQYLTGVIAPQEYDEESGEFVIGPTEEWKDEIYYQIFTITSYAYFGLIILFGILTLLALNQRFSVIQFNTQNRKIIRKMGVIALTNTVVYLTVILWNLFSYSSVFVMISVSDVLSLSMPYILMICDKNVQEVIFKKKKSLLPSNAVLMQRNSSIRTV